MPENKPSRARSRAVRARMNLTGESFAQAARFIDSRIALSPVSATPQKAERGLRVVPYTPEGPEAA